MKKIIVLYCFYILCAPAFAQDTVKLNVVYEFSYVRDLENNKDPYKANMILSLGKNSSRYCPEKLFNENDKKAIAARKRQQERMEGSPSGSTTVVAGSPMLTISKHGAIINEEISKNFSRKKLTVDAKIALRTYHVEADLPEITWTVSTETKKIGGYDCQKASGNYGGRTYEAWFTTQIPYRDGPWKLHGLPGLILEAKDTENEVSFTFKEITKNKDAEETTQSFLYSSYSINTNVKDLSKAKMAFEKDPEGVMSAQAPNARLVIKNIDDPLNKSVVKIKKYNPMELR
jgi:GLPGLI family protein